MGSIALDVAIREGTEHKGPTQHLLFAIASYANPDGAGARVSVATLAAVTGISERAVQYALRRLVESGDLAISTGRGRGHVSEYAIDLALLRARADLRRAAAREKVQRVQPVQGSAAEKVQPAPFSSSNGATGAPFSAERVQTRPAGDPEKVQADGGKGAAGAPHRVRSDRVNDRSDPAPAAARARATVAIEESRELLGHVSGLDPGEPLLVEVLAAFPALDPREQLVEIAAYAKTRPREAWTADRVRRWLSRSDERRRERTNGTAGERDGGADAADVGGAGRRRAGAVGAGHYAGYSVPSDAPG